ncbi:hypothetical protein [Herbaspirillum sp. VT-16-41]|uniref:hypothetical protein n=1 Tax=Herbaspirillum sp. VT-16-41 TaxID=1953765 RepID=UPI000980AA69|nr:hypothetical protein [Herbaspirillum sp. VT-16-41]ONN63812.1 hypothetical protein BTM36_25595 [Herbaspirillum sp. VT-16-41]
MKLQSKTFNKSLATTVLMSILVIGLMIFMFGIGQEVHGQAQLLKTSLFALYEYKNSFHHLQEPVEFLTNGLMLKHKSFGGNLQAIGFIVIAFAPITFVSMWFKSKVCFTK